MDFQRLMKLALYLIHAAALLGTIAWYVSSPSWEPVVVFLTLIATFIGVTRMKDERRGSGRGGSAINAGQGARVDLANEGAGIVRAGKGGTGGSGGDAIHVAPGVNLKIINRGLIAGGDAGDAKSDK